MALIRNRNKVARGVYDSSMAPQVFPDNHIPSNQGERLVLTALRDQLPDDVEVYCNYKRFDGFEERELDFVVSVPNLGLAVLEVKGSQWQTIGGEWKQFRRNTNTWERKDIPGQLGAEKRMLDDAYASRFERPFPVTTFMLVIPETYLATDSLTPGFNRNAVVDKAELKNLYSVILRQIALAAGSKTYPDDVRLIVRELLAVTGETYESIVATSAARGVTIDTLSREQIALLDFMDDNERLLVRGGPGTGKTVLAIEQASRLAGMGLKVGLVCYNDGLARKLKQAAGRLKKDVRPAFKGNIQRDFAEYLGIALPPMPTEYSERQKHFVLVPEIINDFVRALPETEKFDAWIVDEAQDFGEIHLDILRNSLKDPEKGIIHMFGDRDQDLFGGAKVLPWFFAKGTLRRNLRSSIRIAELLQTLSDRASVPSGVINGVPPEKIVVPDDKSVVEASREYVDYLINELHWEPGRIAVIHTHYKPQEQIDAVNDSQDKYWDIYFDNKEVFYTHVSTFKGLERAMIVVVVDGYPSEADPERQVYVATSRALDDVVIIGHEMDLYRLGETFQRLANSEYLT